MSFLIAGAVVAGAGIAKAISGGVQKKKAKAEAAKAQAELEAQPKGDFDAFVAAYQASILALAV